MASSGGRVNWIGFLGLVGFMGFLGFLHDAPEAFNYFAYFGYFSYFGSEITEEKRWVIRTAGTAAYLLAFATNMSFIAVSYVRGTVDYEAGFYLAYILGSVSFPIISFVLETASSIRGSRAKREASA